MSVLWSGLFPPAWHHPKFLWFKSRLSSRLSKNIPEGQNCSHTERQPTKISHAILMLNISRIDIHDKHFAVHIKCIYSGLQANLINCKFHKKVWFSCAVQVYCSVSQLNRFSHKNILKLKWFGHLIHTRCNQQFLWFELSSWVKSRSWLPTLCALVSAIYNYDASGNENVFRLRSPSSSSSWYSSSTRLTCYSSRSRSAPLKSFHIVTHHRLQHQHGEARSSYCRSELFFIRCVCLASTQQVNMPYVMIPAFHPNTQPLPVTSDPQMTLPLQPIPCKPGQSLSESESFQTWDKNAEIEFFFFFLR